MWLRGVESAPVHHIEQNPDYLSGLSHRHRKLQRQRMGVEVSPLTAIGPR